MRIWRETERPHQTIGFELPDLPGQTFRLTVPELISDSKEALLPWSLPSPEWDIEQDSARCSIEIEGIIRMDAQVLFRGEKTDVVVSTTNLSTRVWDKVNLFTCFAYYAAPLFNDPDLTRTYFPVGKQAWKSVRELFTQQDPGSGPFTFFPVRGPPALSELWVCRQIEQHHPQVVSQGAACVLSKDKKWVAGMTTQTPAYVFNNRSECCIHADPLLGTMNPGDTIEDFTTVHIIHGSLEDFQARLSR